MASNQPNPPSHLVPPSGRPVPIFPTKLEELLLPTPEEEARLLRAVATVSKLKPWDQLNDDHLLGVEDPDTKEIGFVGCLGSLEDNYGVLVYRGAEGLLMLRTFMALTEDLDDEDEEEMAAASMELLKIPQLQATLEAREDLADWDEELISRHKVKGMFKGMYPQFRSLRAGYLPWRLDGQETRFLTAVLEQLAEVLDDRRFSARTLVPKVRLENEVPVYTVVCQRQTQTLSPTGEPLWKQEHMDVRPPEPYSIDLSAFDADLEKIATKKSDPAPLEVDVNTFPMPVVPEDERPFFPEVILLGRKGMIVGQEVTDQGFWAGAVPGLVGILVETLKEMPRKPAEIWIADPRLEVVVGHVCHLAGIKRVLKEELPGLDPAWQGMYDMMGSGLMEDMDFDMGDLDDLPDLPEFKLH